MYTRAAAGVARKLARYGLQELALAAGLLTVQQEAVRLLVSSVRILFIIITRLSFLQQQQPH